jgi:hypothetical protein
MAAIAESIEIARRPEDILRSVVRLLKKRGME